MIVPEIRRLDSYYSSSLEIVNVFEKIVAKLCKGNVQDNIDAMNAITKLLADIMCFSYDFDQAKVSKFQIQNDFSYYKRVLTRMKSSPNVNPSSSAQDPPLILLFPTGRRSVYHAWSKGQQYISFLRPILPANQRDRESVHPDDRKGMPPSPHTLSNAPQDPTGAIRSRILELLPKISQMCSNIVSSGASGDLTSYCIKVLANVIVLYDHSDPAGAFVRGSKLNVRKTHHPTTTH